MTTAAVQTFVALLALMVLVLTAGLIVCRLAARRSSRAARTVGALRPAVIALAAAIAAGAMAGSLYFSEVAHYLPCTLCWYQRIAMYSVAIILVIAAVRRDVAIRPYVIVLAGLGAFVSTYHWLLERFPSLDAGTCSPQIPCEFVWFEKFGFVTLPFMAFTGFAAVITLITLPVED